MRNYDKIMKEMTIEQMAKNNVHLVNINNARLGWLTSNGHIFPYNEYDYAVTFELAWLKTPLIDPEKSETLEPEKKVAQC